MQLHQRPLHLPDDLPSALQLADSSGLNFPHVADWPYRFSSWALDQIENTQVWLGPAAEVLGWVVMQAPFWAIDCIVHPNAPTTLYRDMLAWAQARAKQMQAAGAGRPMWFVSIPANCISQRHDLEALGFKDQAHADDDAWSKVLFELPHDAPVPVAPLPEGYSVRNLNPTTEIQAYVDLHRQVFNSESMTVDWRKHATRGLGYINDLDLVIASDQGVLQGFCIAWLRTLTSGEVVGQIEPLGVRESQRGRGFSKAIMSEAIYRLRKHGATRIFVETDRQRDSAMAAYASMGFQVAHEVLVCRWEVVTNRV